MDGQQDAFELSIRVEPPDIDELGHVNNVVYVRWVQEVAMAHWLAGAPTGERERLAWVVLRHEIDYRQAARLGDEIVAKTWVGTASRVRFERHTEIYRASDRTVLAKARTLWCPIDIRTGKPASVSAEVRSKFSQPAVAGE